MTNILTQQSSEDISATPLPEGCLTSLPLISPPSCAERGAGRRWVCIMRLSPLPLGHSYLDQRWILCYLDSFSQERGLRPQDTWQPLLAAGLMFGYKAMKGGQLMPTLWHREVKAVHRERPRVCSGAGRELRAAATGVPGLPGASWSQYPLLPVISTTKPFSPIINAPFFA